MSIKQYLGIGFMLFALFLGAGNIIFPPFLGQMAGEKLPVAIIGFLVTGVGLPLVAVLAIAKSGEGLQSIASRVSPKFGIVFTFIVYLAIGPFFGIPRTATVSYEIGIVPFISFADEWWALALFSLFFFTVVIALALNPAKLVDRIGKVLTPILLLVIGALAIKSIISPMGPVSDVQPMYQSHPFFKGFIEGYLTMDVIAALVFGSIVIQALNREGITERSAIMRSTALAGVIASIGLSLVYLSLSYIGATSVSVLGLQENGGEILALASKVLYGQYGTIILALTIVFACLTTAIGLVSACAQFLNYLFPAIKYPIAVYIFAVFSMFIANFGLTELINISVPILMMIYPVAIALIMLSFVDKWFGRDPFVYICALVPIAIVSIFHTLLLIKVPVPFVGNFFESFPLYNQQIGWLLPGTIGLVIGLILQKLSGRMSKHTY